MSDRLDDYEVKVESAPRERVKSDAELKGEAIGAWLDANLGVRFWCLTALVVGSLIFGSPHLLIQYKCYGRCGQNDTKFNCEYLGIGGWKVANPPNGKCAPVRLM